MASVGSSVSRRTLRHAVIEGKQVAFHLSERWVVMGWLAGMDDFHWKVVEGSGEVFLIHKASALVSIPPIGCVLEDLTDEQRETVEAIAGPFREAMRRERAAEQERETRA